MTGRRGAFYVILSTALLLVASPGFSATVVSLGTLSNFDGPNDLPLSGNIVYAVDIGPNVGPPPDVGPPSTINGVPFTFSGSGGAVTPTPGFSTNFTQGPFGFGTYAYTDGAAADNTALNRVMNSIMCCSVTGAANNDTFSFAVTPGNDYKVSVLWGEPGGGANRNWDLAIEGALALDQVFSNGSGPPGPTPGNPTGTMWTHTLTAGDASLDIRLGNFAGQGPTPGADTNYIVSAFIIEDVTPAAIPEPTTIGMWSLVGVVVAGFGWRRWRSKK